jgi:chemotaxis protein methyltransferase CheR
MQDLECVALLQWMLPALGLRWEGFRRVRKQVCDALCTVTITRFYRDKGVFAYLGSTVLPELGARALAARRTER